MKQNLLIAFFLALAVGLSAQFDATNYSIAFLTKDVDSTGVLEEQGLIDDLRSRGFEVDVTYNDPGDITVTPDFDFSYAALEDYDLVILGRGVSSGDFTDAEDWAAVTTPIITFSAYLMRSSRLKLINSGSASREVSDGTTVDMNRVTNADIVSTHPVLTGLNADMDNQIGYLTWFYDYIAYGRDTFEMNHNATLLASLNHPGGPGDGTVAMAHWAAGVETYPGGVTLAGQRATFLMGSDDSSSPKLRNFTAFTSESTIALHNLIKQLLGATPDGVEIPVLFDANNVKIAFITKDVDATGTLNEQGIISDLRQRGFEVDVTYNDPNDITVTPDFDFSYAALEEYDLVILGRGVSSGDFQDAEDWAAVTTPIITFSTYLMRSSRLKLVNSSTAGRAWIGENDAPPVIGDDINMDTVYNVSINSNSEVFNGVDLDMNGEIGFHTWFHDYLGYGADTFEMNHNATLLASWIDPAAVNWNNAVAAAHWDAGVETYPGGVTLSGPRAIFTMGSDDRATPKNRNYTAFTDESTIVFHNLIQMLLGYEPNGEEIPFSGPAAQYSFEGTGDMVTDGIGSANGDIRNGNGITRESCGVNNSINFAGATKLDAIIWAEDSPAIDFDGSKSFAVSLWAKIDPFANVAEMNLVLKGDNKNDGTHLPNGNGHYYTLATKDNELRFAVDDDVVKTQLGVAIDATMFSPTAWNHIVGVMDVVQDSLFLYLNGVQIGSILNETDMDMSTTGLPLVIGNYHSGARRINGALDEVEIYDRILSATAIADMYASAAPTTTCTVVETIEEISDDATLSALTVDVGTLTPAFDPSIPNYTLVTPAGTTEVTISATTNFPAATLVGDGVFSTLPGTATITVTAEDGTTTKDYSIGITIEGQGGSKTIVPAGFDNLFNAINDAVSGDTLVLINGESYSPVGGSYAINKNIVIIAETIPTLPALDNMPVIDNIFGVSPLFQMNFGGDLVLIGIDVNGGGAANIIDCQGDLGVPTTQSIYINRCRLHNTTDDILNDARDGNVDMTTLESCIVRNTFIYDSGAGHGLYVKNYHGEGTFIFENITYWNVGQQFNWIRHYPAGITQSFVYNHMTGYNLSTDLGQNKELFGNSDADTESALDIQLKNSIFHTQVSTNEGSFKFNNTLGQSNITTNNNVLFQLQPIVDLGSINHFDNQEGVDPQFQDPGNADFTVLNDALWTAADDGEIIGATYWLPNFVDNFSDLNPTSTDDLAVLKIALKAFPNPFSEVTHFSFHLENSADVNLKIYDLMGREIQTVVNARLASGDHTLEVPTEHLQNGVYVYRFVSNGVIIANKLIKNSK